MKYGISYANGALESFECAEAAGKAREAFNLARGGLFDGESISLFSVSLTGFRSTLEKVTQPKISDLSELMN